MKKMFFYRGKLLKIFINKQNKKVFLIFLLFTTKARKVFTESREGFLSSYCYQGIAGRARNDVMALVADASCCVIGQPQGLPLRGVNGDFYFNAMDAK